MIENLDTVKLIAQSDMNVDDIKKFVTSQNIWHFSNHKLGIA